MQTWLYQMSDKDGWTPEDYRLSVWEGETVDWPTGRVTKRSAEDLKSGDVVFFFFTKTTTPQPGLYGWALITKVRPRSDRFQFRALPHSDVLKVDPIYNTVTKRLIERIRGNFNQGTMWSIEEADSVILKNQIRKH